MKKVKLFGLLALYFTTFYSCELENSFGPAEVIESEDTILGKWLGICVTDITYWTNDWTWDWVKQGKYSSETDFYSLEFCKDGTLYIDLNGSLESWRWSQPSSHSFLFMTSQDTLKYRLYTLTKDTLRYYYDVREEYDEETYLYRTFTTCIKF